MKLKITLACLLLSLLTNGQEINVRVGGTNYLTGSTYSAFSTPSGTSSTAVTFTIQNTLAASVLNLTGTPIVEVDGPDAALFTVNETGTSSTLTNVSNTTFTVTFSPTTPGAKSAFFTILSNDADEAAYTVNLTGTSTVTATSAIIITPSYTYPQNIPYQNYQATDITNTSNDIEIASFTLRDGTGTPDADNLPTTLTDLTFSLSNSANIRSVALYDGATEIAEEDGAASVVFTGMSLVAPDNGTKIFTIRVSYNNVVTDNLQNLFTVSSATALSTGSLFAAANAGGATNSNASNNNRIEVTATKLDFIVGPSGTDTFVAMSPSIIVHALDVFDNRDLDYTAAVILTTSGSFDTVGPPANDANNNASAGIATFPIIKHSVAGTGLFLTANSGSLTAAVSDAFDIGPASGASNFFRSRASGDWSTASNWETSHNNVDSWITSTLVPTNVSRGIRILNGHTITCTTTENGDQMSIDNGGTFVLDTGANFTLSNPAGNDLTVNGTFTYNGGTLNKVGVIVFGATGIYNHAIASATLTLPIATWNAATICNVTGLNNATAITGMNMNQNFGVFNWNNPNQVGPVIVNHDTFRVSGTLNIGTTTANANNVLCLADSGTHTNTIRNINVSGGKLIAASGTSTTTTTITGTTAVAGGQFIVSNGSGTSTASLAGVTTISGGEFIASQGSGIVTLSAANTFTISGGQFILINSAGSGNASLTITPNNRDLNVTGTGALLLEKVSSATGIASITLNRSLVVSSTAVPAIDFGTGTVTDNAINIKTNLTKSNDGTFTTTSASSAKGFVFFNTGAQTLTYSGANSSSVNYTVNSGSQLTMGSNLTFGSAAGPESVFTVLNGGRINMGTRIITGNATSCRMNIESGATLSSTSTGGIGGTGAIGSFQDFGSVNLTPATGRLSLPAGVHYALGGVTTTPFPVGGGIAFGNPATVITSANITSNMTSALTVTSAFTVSSGTFKLNTSANNLVLDNAILTVTGVFDNNGENQIINGGGSPSITISGRFITRDVQGFVGANTAIPTITPTLLTASTVEYAFAGNQAVQGGPSYRNLTVSGTGTKTLASNASVATLITVASPCVFDVQSFTAGGTGTAFIMTGTANYKTAGTGVKPDATGTYSLAVGSTIEFYGTQPIEIRLGSPAISYGRIIVNGTDVANNSTTTGILFGSPSGTFTVKNGATFKFNNTNGFTGSTSTAISNAAAVSPILETTSTVEYAGANQTITPYNSSTNNSYKKLNISGTGVKTLAASPILIRDNLNVTSSLLTIEDGRSLTVTNGITTVDTDETNGILVENNGSLVQVTVVDNDLTNNNTGNINVERITPDVYRYDFTYWSSPVKNFTLNALSPLTLFNKYMYWNASTSAWVINTNGTEEMVPGKGYLVRAPQTFSADPGEKEPYTALFDGVPNNGNVTYATHGNGASTPSRFNLLGNPYPSAIDIEKFLLANNTKLQGTIYLWTHATPIDGTTYNSSDYAVYNFSGPVTPFPLGGTGGATKYVAAGQGFFVKGTSAGASTVTFTNAMRETVNNDNFFRPGPTTPVENWETTGKHRVWLNLTQDETAFNQLLVGYIENATDTIDWGYDGEQFGGNQLKFYSLIEGKNFTIQGKALPFDAEDEVPIGYKSTVAGNLQISIDQYDGLFVGQDIYLEDQLLNVVHDLKEAAYEFTTTIGTFNDRFILRYTPDGTLATPDPTHIANGVIVYKDHDEILIKSALVNLQSVTVYDLLGRAIFGATTIGTNTFTISNVAMNEQPLIIKTILANGQVVNKKIVY